MANLSHYGSDNLAEVHNPNNVTNNVLNQVVQAMPISEQSDIMNQSETERNSDINIIRYSLYGKSVTSVVGKQGTNAVKSSSCWVLRPKIKAVLKEMCDKKNSVLFTETECLILSPDFKLPDENQVLLKVPRKNNMYSFDLKNVVPSKGLTCLFTKAINDESNLWHRRLGHINFKTMSKLVKGNNGNNVRCLPSKFFENDQTCVACQKGKQHKASVLMIECVIHTMKVDMVIHTEKTKMMRLVVEIKCVGKIADAFDKATGPSDYLQPEQVDLNYVHAFNEPHLDEIRVVPIFYFLELFQLGPDVYGLEVPAAKEFCLP
nr:putative ribonuclease H-like domain-containing protein [Tanacetum cinerariifolium]